MTKEPPSFLTVISSEELGFVDSLYTQYSILQCHGFWEIYVNRREPNTKDNIEMKLIKYIKDKQKEGFVSDQRTQAGPHVFLNNNDVRKTLVFGHLQIYPTKSSDMF